MKRTRTKPDRKPEPISPGGVPAATYEPLASLVPWARNPRQNEDAIREVTGSIRRFGFGAPVLARLADRRILAGHTRVEAARRLGLTAIPVRFLDLSEREADALALADNKLGESAEWDEDALRKILRDLSAADTQISGLGWSDKDLADLISTLPTAPPDLDEAPKEEPEEPPDVLPDLIVSRVGELYELGPHRLYCGDSLKPETLRLLLGEGGKVDAVFTDPPFAIFGSSTGIASNIADDKMVRPFFEQVLRQIDAALIYTGVAYVCCDWRSWASWWEEARQNGRISVKNMLIWDKNGSGLGSNWANTYEILAYMIKMPPEKTVRGHENEHKIPPILAPNILRGYNRPVGEERYHNAAKPVDMVSYVLDKTQERRPEPITRVLDLFAGGGSTLMSCAKTGRVCFTSEVEPRYVDQIRRRYTRWARSQGLDPGPGALD